MKKCQKLTVGVLSAALLLTGAYLPAGQTSLGTTAAYADSDPAETKLPGTDKTEGEFDTSYFSVTGFAKGSVNDRTAYIGTDAYRVVTTEEEFLRALDDARSDEVEVIEIAADLDLGWDRLSAKEQAYSCINAYGWENTHVITNPSVLESNVSQLTISNITGLTIFSKAGNTVEHAEWKLQSSSTDIVIRNITFDGMWYWNNSSKETGWTPLKLNGVKGVWIDHCSTTLGVDGNMDSENGAENMTASWNSFGLSTEEALDTNGMIYKSVTYLEELYQMGSLASVDSESDTTLGKYKRLREGNTPVEKIMEYSAYHQKLSLNGSGDKDFKDGKGLEDGNQRLHITYAYDKATNIGSRFPLIRQGTAHMFNCLVDNSTHMAIHNDSAYPLLSYYGLNRAIDGRNGATVGADTCVYKEVRAITGGEIDTDESTNTPGTWSWALQNAYNHVLIVNSTVTLNDKTYTGSSWDNNGINLFVEGYKNDTTDIESYWVDKSTIGDFHWFSSIVDGDTDKYTRGTIPDEPFTFTYSEGDDNVLPYSYKTVSLDDVEDVVNKYAGAYTIVADASFWLRTEYSADETNTYQLASEIGDVKVESLTLSTDTMTADAGTLRQIDAVAAPSNATNKEVTWSSSDESIAEVRDSGLVVAKSAGTVTITATTTDGTNLSASTEVTVEVPIESIEIEGAPPKIYLGEGDADPESYQLTAVISPENATLRDVVWTSSNSNVLSVDENGVLTAHKASASKVTITCASATDSDVKESVRITVKSGANPDPTPTPEATAQPTEAPETSAEPANTPEAPVGVSYWMGDVDLDNAVTVSDALRILQEVVSIKDLADDPQAAPYVLADMDGDGAVTVSDALVVLQTVVSLKAPVQVTL